MMSWRDTCDSTIRIAAQILSRGQPPLSQQLNEVSQQVVLGNMTPAAAQQLQSGLDSWYALQQDAAKSREVSTFRTYGGFCCYWNLCRNRNRNRNRNQWCECYGCLDSGGRSGCVARGPLLPHNGIERND